MAKARLTKRFIDSIAHTDKGQSLYMDEDLPGFGLLVGKSSKTYFAQRSIQGKTVRVTIGKHGIFTPEQARTDAKELMVRMARGENPNQTKRNKAVDEMTFSEACDAYETGRKGLSDASIYKLERCKDKWFADWMSKPLCEIKKDMIFKRHAKLGEDYGSSTANKAMRTLRAIYNFATISNDRLPANPVRALSLSKSWYEEEVRHSVIKPTQLSAWYNAVMQLDNATIRDYLLLLLFTGMRKNEGLALRWENIDFKEKTIKVPETKNGRPLLLPMSDYLLALLKERKVATGKSQWVFPSSITKGHLVEPGRAVDEVIEESKVKFMLHDLRRTFITTAESLDISSYALKQLVNHSQGRDVTSGYIVMNIERLREPMQKVAIHILATIQGDKKKQARKLS